MSRIDRGFSYGRWYLGYNGYGVAFVHDDWGFGYYSDYYDGPLHFFALGPIHFSYTPF